MRGLIPRAVLAGLGAGLGALWLLAAPLLAPAAPRPGPRAVAATLLAGAAAADLSLPAGTPLGGYGGFPRRALVPDVLRRFPNAFWFRPSIGAHEPMRVRALVLESAGTRMLWLTADLVGVDPGLLERVAARLREAGLAYAAVVLAASHSHSGPGAYAESELFGFLALDRLSPAVRDSIVDGLAHAAREAEASKVRARIAVGRADVSGITESRVQGPLDTELGVLKVTAAAGRPIALVWNYAIHGTALGRNNLLLSGDLMGDASLRLERDLGVPALYVNGAVGDVSPRPRGWAGVATAGRALADGARAAWEQAQADPDPRLDVVREPVALPSPALSLHNCIGRWIPGNVLLGLAQALPSSAEVMGLAVGDTAWVTIPGELDTRLGLDVKAAAGPRFRRVFIAGVSNDYLGYLVSAAAYRKPSYIACGSLYGERGGEIVRDGALAALRRLGARRGSR